MRIATLILSIVVFGIISFQSCAAFALGGLADSMSDGKGEQAASGAGGILVAIVTLVALAFVWGLPFVSMILYIIAALSAFATAAMGFPDMNIWGFVLLVLAVLSFFGWREKRKKRAPAESAV